MSARDDRHESASSHLRNALQILEGLGWALKDRATWTLEFEGLRDRIRRALLLVEDPPLISYELTPAGLDELERAKELEQLRGVRLVITPAACVFCGCTQETACSIAVDQLSDDARNAVDLYRYERGEQLGETVPCWWVSLNPPVCSRPACVAALEERRALRSSSLAPLATRAPEHGGPV